MTYVYKRLPTGGYTALPAESPVVLKRLVSQGWSVDPPVDAPVVADPVVPPAEAEAPEPAPRKRGRQRAESVN